MQSEVRKFMEMQPVSQLSLFGKITPIGWEPAGDLSYEQWEHDGQLLQRLDGSLNWIIGDWLNYGERKYGEMYSQAIEVTGHKIDRLQVAKWVSSAVRCSTRVEHLSFTHHRYIAHLPEAEEPPYNDITKTCNVRSNSPHWKVRAALPAFVALPGG